MRSSSVKVETVDSKHEMEKDQQQQQDAKEPRPYTPKRKSFGLDYIRRAGTQDKEPCRSQEAQPRNLWEPGLRDRREVEEAKADEDDERTSSQSASRGPHEGPRLLGQVCLSSNTLTSVVNKELGTLGS